MQEIVNTKSAKLIQTIGKVIKKNRMKQGKTVYAISAESSVPISTWRDTEEGVSKNIHITTLWKIAEGLDISMSELMNEISKDLGDDFSLADIK